MNYSVDQKWYELDDDTKLLATAFKSIREQGVTDVREQRELLNYLFDGEAA